MATIVEYTAQKPAQDCFPARIISPPHSSPCCFTEMEVIGAPREDGRWLVQYKRCRHCGFTVRLVLRETPDAALLADLRGTLAGLRDLPG
jgi:hypothetical protein